MGRGYGSCVRVAHHGYQLILDPRVRLKHLARNPGAVRIVLTIENVSMQSAAGSIPVLLHQELACVWTHRNDEKSLADLPRPRIESQLGWISA